MLVIKAPKNDRYKFYRPVEAHNKLFVGLWGAFNREIEGHNVLTRKGGAKDNHE